MARISDSKGRMDENSGYTRLFGSPQLGQLMSRVQAAVIRAGNELEDIIQQETPARLKSRLSEILMREPGMLGTERPEVEVVFRPQMPRTAQRRAGHADIAVFEHRIRRVLIVEIKEGDTFDTKKASGELYSMKEFADWIAERTGYDTTYAFCSFNQDNREAIVRGAKRRFDIEHAMTGRELCAILQIDYDVIRRRRRTEQPENLQYFIEELVKIPEMRELLRQILDREDVAEYQEEK
jgi:hypothetical protein